MQYLIAEFGQQSYGTAYATLSTCAMASVGWGYWRHSQGIRLWLKPPPGFAAGAFVFQALGLIGFAQLVPRVQLPVKLAEKEDGVAAVQTSPEV